MKLQSRPASQIRAGDVIYIAYADMTFVVANSHSLMMSRWQLTLEDDECGGGDQAPFVDCPMVELIQVVVS